MSNIGRAGVGYHMANAGHFSCQCHRHSLGKLPINIYYWGLLTRFKLCWSDDLLHNQIEHFIEEKHCFCSLSFSFCFLVSNFSKKTNQNMHQMEAQQQKSCHWQKKYYLMQFSSLLFTFLKTCQFLESQKRGASSSSGLLFFMSWMFHQFSLFLKLFMVAFTKNVWLLVASWAAALQYYNAKYVEYMHNRVGSHISYLASLLWESFEHKPSSII